MTYSEMMYKAYHIDTIFRTWYIIRQAMYDAAAAPYRNIK